MSAALFAAFVSIAGQVCAQSAAPTAPDGSVRDGSPASDQLPSGGRLDNGKLEQAPETSGATGPGTASSAAGASADCPPQEGERPTAARERSADAGCGPTRDSGAAQPVPKPPAPDARTPRR
jgi:hypothetical protein